MSERLLAEVIAEYVLKNRENGWLKYALQVLAAGPYIRHALIRELCDDVRTSLAQRLPDHNVAAEPGDIEGWFSVDITQEAWGQLGISLGNWKTDASEVAIGVYNYDCGTDLSDVASGRIRECLGTKRTPWNRRRHPQWIWNIWPDWSTDWTNWSSPVFLMRIADEREAVVAEVGNDMVEVVELADQVLKIPGQADSSSRT